MSYQLNPAFEAIQDPGKLAIATFDDNGKYPTDTKGKHAAVYLGHGPGGIRVLDQWNRKGRVSERTIFSKKLATHRVDSAKFYYVIE